MKRRFKRVKKEYSPYEMREVGWLGALVNTNALCTADLQSSFALGRAVLCSGSEGYKCPHGSWGVCLPGLWSWKFKACACMDSQQLQTLGRFHSFCPRMKYENA